MMTPMPCPCCGQMLPDSADLRIDDAGIVVRGGRFVTLPLKELDLLRVLHNAGSRFVDRQRISSLLWPVPDEAPESAVIESHVSKLRRKVKPLGLRVECATRGVGAYRLVIGKVGGEA